MAKQLGASVHREVWPSIGTYPRRWVSNALRHACPRGAIFMAFSMAGGGPSTPQINVTPLIDILLVLIIVFMVVVSMSKTKGLEAQIPQPAPDDTSQPVPVDRTIVIQVVWGAQNPPPALKINQE